MGDYEWRYKPVIAKSLDELEIKVTTRLNMGYGVHGSLLFANSLYIQPMISHVLTEDKYVREQETLRTNHNE